MRTLIALLSVPAALLVACGDESGPESGAGSGGTGTPQAGSTSGGTANAGTSSGKGGSMSGAAGSASGAANTGGSTMGGQGGAMAGGTGGKGGAGASGSSGSAGALGGAGNGGASGTVSAGTGGLQAGTGGTSGSATGGAGTGGTGSTECTREFLQGLTDAYFEALAANDPSSLPLAASLKFTENGEESEIGTAGLWENAGELQYAHTALDTETCTSLSQAVVPAGTTDIPLALRLKVENGEFTEVEMIAVRQGDYSVASNTGALAASANTVGWEEPVDEADSNTREEITGWMNKYFRMFPAGVCNTTMSCVRLENGGGSYDCGLGGSCAGREPGASDNVYPPRLIFADVERGLGVGFTMFQNQYTDMHMFKMYGDQVHGVSAILVEAADSGWD